jgi:DNA-binding beta-propeller fold protein YncE
MPDVRRARLPSLSAAEVSAPCCTTPKFVKFAAQKCGPAYPWAAHSYREKHMLNGKGRLGLATLACVGLAIAFSAPSAAWNRGAVQTFALIPSIPSIPSPKVEGLTVGPDGKVYAATFNPTASQGPAQLFTFDPQGHLLASVPINIVQQGLPPKPSSPAMLGLEVIPGTTNALLVLDFGAGQVLAVDPTTGNASVCITLPVANPGPPQNGLNGITFDKAGNVYFSDSFAGTIWRYSPTESGSQCGGTQKPATAWVTDPSLLPNDGVPPFGANGVEFNKAGDTMFVCNTAMDWIVKITVSTKTLEVFTNSINGCDGLRLDSDDNIWVAANQADEIVVVDSTTGKAIGKLGDFDGVNHGVTNGLLFPASPAFSPDGKTLYVTNLELDLRTVTTPPETTVDSDWTTQVEQHSIARLGARIPPIQSSQ